MPGSHLNEEKEFLLAEHEYFREAFWRNEEIGG